MAAQLFMTEVEKPLVKIVMSEGQTFVMGLPLMRVGNWNGIEYTAEVLQQMADNFTIIKAADSFEPSLKPYHGFDNEGNVNQVDSREIMGWFNGLYYDAMSQVLYGDVRQVDWGLEEGMRSGKLRYLSTEVVDAYEVTTAEGNKQQIGWAMVSTAWVDYPAVKGLDWELIVNRSDYSDKTKQRNNSAPKTRSNSAQKGGTPQMGLLDKFKALFIKAGLTEDDVKDLDDIEAPIDDKTTVNTATTPEPPAAGGTDSDEVTRLRTELEELKLAHANSMKAARQGVLATQVDALVNSGHIKPADRAMHIAIVNSLDTSGGKVMINSADNKQSEVSTVDAYLQDLKAKGAQVKTNGAGIPYINGDNPGEPETVSDADLEALVKKIN